MYESKYAPLTPVYGREEIVRPVPRGEIAECSMPADSVYELINNELLLDASTGLNLATFCNEGYTDPWGEKLVMENIRKNFIDHHEYPASNIAEGRCTWMLAREFGTTFAPGDEDPDTATGFYGTATIGSSEAVMLGLVAHKYRWTQTNRKNLMLGLADPQDRPVVLMSAHVHGCWDKFCNYFEATALYVTLASPPYSIDGADVLDILNTSIDDPDSPYAATIRRSLNYLKPQGRRSIGELVMCVGAVVGTTFTGACDDVASVDDAVEEYCASQSAALNVDIPIHVDAASGGFVTLFSHNGKDIHYRFNETRRVRSINTSNHKYGMTFPGMGSVIFRDNTVVDASLIYNITYLGGTFRDFTVNFSRGSNMILMQYYNFLNFGRSGYRKIIDNCLKNTTYFVEAMRGSPVLSKYLKNISDSAHLPIIVLTWADDAPKRGWSLTDVSHLLRQDGWVAPSYVLPQTSPEQNLASDKGVQVLRIVVQQVVTRDKLSRLLTCLEAAMQALDEGGQTPRARKRHRTSGYRC
ncbi:MAG TPA: pyridoxal-dependent decarboxylase [Caulobacteraceae bacterium]|nr:pyridoxal-dependent decarboxylase [Caulobacteraceae bacterium]